MDNAADLEPLMTTQELADYLAVSVATIYDWRTNCAGPRAYRVGRHTRYKAADVIAWLDAQEISA